MKYIKLFVLFVLLASLSVSCSKGHYDVSNVHGVNAEGELLFPVASKSFTIKDLMERFEVLDMIEWTESGDMTFCFDVENIAAVNGADMLKFNDVDYEESYVFENDYQDSEPPYTDTMVSFERPVVFESENIHVMRAKMKSGRLDFVVESNLGSVRRVVLRSDNITDGSGNEFEIDIPVNENTFGFDLEGLNYATDTANTLNLSYDLYVDVHGTTDPEVFVHLNVKGRDLAFSEMQGYVDTYSSHSSIDSVFTLFPDNLAGTLEVEGVRISVSERNTFSLGARLVVDTALVYSEGLPPYSVFDPLPVSVDLPPRMDFGKVLDKTLNGKIDALGGRAYATSEFIVNPEGFSEMVTVYDTNRIDTRVSVEIPFSFAVDNIAYLDTVNMNLAHLELPDLIEQLTLELSFTSTLPFNLKGSFFMYDSESERITDTLLLDADLIQASFDNRPVKTDVTLVVDEGRVEHVIHSNRIIMSYWLDSDAHEVDLNVNQKLDLSLKARAKYKNEVDFNEFN